jgi:predicted Zn finger-like uncharacterized protein
MPAMIITCPHCTTRYSVAVTAFGDAARPVRCSNCGHLWTVQPHQLSQGGDLSAKQRAAVGGAGSPRRQAALHRTARPIRKDERQSSSDEGQRATGAVRTPPERPGAGRGERQGEQTIGPKTKPTIGFDKQPDAGEALLGGAAIEDQAPSPLPSPSPSPPAMRAPGDDAATSHGGARDGRAASSNERPEPIPTATADAAAADIPEEPAKDLIPEPAPELEENPARKPASEWRNRMIYAALAAAILAGGLGILLMGRDVIMAGVSSISAIIGLQDPAGAGLDIGAVTSFREETADGDVLIVEGTVTNVSDDARPLPMVRIALFDTDDAELQHVMVVPDQQVLVPGERIAFSARLEQPAPTARRIKVSFAARPEPA